MIGNWVISPHSTILSGGNQVDGVPPSRHTEVVGEPHWGDPPAPIDKLDPRKFKIGGAHD